MSKPLRIGIYFCWKGTAPANCLAMPAVSAYVGGLPDVCLVKDLGGKPNPNPGFWCEEIRRHQLTRIVLAGDSPGFFKPTFTTAMRQAGEDPGEVRLASFQEHGATQGEGTERAKAVTACAALGVPYGLAAVPQSTTVHPDTLVIGGGVAGIQVALEIADAGKHVTLVERSGTIGGHMAMFDKTFPTLDCAACILTPKMVSVGQHENITLWTLSELESVTGRPGAWKATIRRKARYVDMDACVSCHACEEVCPVQVPSEFDSGISTRKAVYLPFPQAVPNAYIIDAEHCTRLLSAGAKCGACLKKCLKEAIHFDEEDVRTEVEVGNIVVATGYDVFDARRMERYGYGTLPNVLTALEFERLTNAAGPTGGRIVLKSLAYNKRTKQEEWVFDPEGKSPASVAIIHCVGSRDHNFNAYCSRVCCMYSLKFAHLVKEKLPEARVYEYYIDMRTFGKGYEQFFERIKDEGVFVVRGRSAKVGMRDGHMSIKGEDMLSDQMLEFPVDMVLLAVGMESAAGTGELAACLGIRRDEDGWFRELDYNIDPTGTERGGVYMAGACQGPKDIPDTVAQASAVAARVLRSIVSGCGRESRDTLPLAEIEARARSLAGVN
jgi:heterodisulfide reductase subunit A